MKNYNYKLTAFFALCAVFIVLNLLKVPSLTDAFSPDSYGFVGFSDYRQPLYGIWMNSAFNILDSWTSVKTLQLTLFCLSAIAFATELYTTSTIGKYCAIGWMIVLSVFSRYGLTDYVASLITEGLFYTILILLSWLMLRWLRSEKLPNLLAVLFLCVLASQLKTAFIPVLLLVALVLIMLLIWSKRLPKPAKRLNPYVLVLGFIIPIMLLPSILGKNFLQISTNKDRLGFVIIPRITSLPTPPVMSNQLTEWSVMADSWRATSQELGFLAFTQFDAQLQEATRFYLYPNEIAPVFHQGEIQLSRQQWIDGSGYQLASELAFEWIAHSPYEYFVTSLNHLMGMLLAAPLMLQTEREQIAIAFTKISQITWEKVELNKAYPLGDLSLRISKITNSFYLLIRTTLVLFLALAAFTIIKAISSFRRRQNIAKSDLMISLSFLTVIALSLAPALTVFPEIRYVFANILLSFTGLFSYLALIKINWKNELMSS